MGVQGLVLFQGGPPHCDNLGETAPSRHDQAGAHWELHYPPKQRARESGGPGEDADSPNRWAPLPLLFQGSWDKRTPTPCWLMSDTPPLSHQYCRFNSF